MKKIYLSGLLINEGNTGIGIYGEKIIENLSGDSYNISAISGKIINNPSVDTEIKKCTGSMQRILTEQFYLPFKYRKYDLIHFIDYSSPLIPAGVPFIITVHDLAYYKFPATFSYKNRIFKKLLAPVSIKRAVKIIVDSRNTKEDLKELFPVSEDKIEVIYPGSPNYREVKAKDKLEEVKNRYNVDSEYILYLGTLEPRKNLSRLIDAYYLLFKRGIKEKLVLAGKKGWLYKDIFKKVKELNLQDRIIFTGYIEERDKPLLYSAARLFIYPSLYEGFGLPPLEAMSCGTPVIVSGCSSLPEVVGEAGLYVDPRSVKDIARKMNRLITHSRLREELKGKGLKRTEKFSWQNSARQIRKVYHEILG